MHRVRELECFAPTSLLWAPDVPRSAEERRALYAEALETEVGIELLNPKRADLPMRHCALLPRAGTVDEVMAVLSDEFGISAPGRSAPTSEAALTLDRSPRLRRAEGRSRRAVDLRAFMEI